MRAGTRLALYGLGLVVAFFAAFGIAKAVVPDSVVDRWEEQSAANSHGHASSPAGADDTRPDLRAESHGYVLSEIEAPGRTGVDGELRFQIRGESGEPVTAAATDRRALSLVVVRADGAHFRLVHPESGAGTGHWSVPWRWDEPGMYRVYADFTPAGETTAVTLAREVHVADDAHAGGH